MALLEVKNVKTVYTARFGEVKVEALADVSFSVEEGEYAVSYTHLTLPTIRLG